MRKTLQNVLSIGACILFAVLIFAAGTANPKLAIAYQTQTNEAGHCVAYFVITNIGNVTTTSYGTGGVEMFGQDHMLPVGCETGHPSLNPGAADTVKVFLPALVKGRWRFTFIFVRDGWGYCTKRGATSGWIN